MDEMGRRVRRAWREWAPMEIVFTIFGWLTYALAGVCALSVVVLIVNFYEADAGFPAGPGFLRVMKIYGIGFFTAAAIAAYFLGRWFLESRVRDARRIVAARYEVSRIATELAQEPDFQKAGTWEWRERVAVQLAPELKEYAESDDWEDRRFARQTIKEAWALYLKRKDEG